MIAIDNKKATTTLTMGDRFLDKYIENVPYKQFRLDKYNRMHYNRVKIKRQARGSCSGGLTEYRV